MTDNESLRSAQDAVEYGAPKDGTPRKSRRERNRALYEQARRDLEYRRMLGVRARSQEKLPGQIGQSEGHSNRG